MNALEIMASARNSGRRSINEAYGKEILSEFQIAVPKSVIVTSPEQVEAAVSGLNPPFAVKVMSENILHKSDAGGVALRAGQFFSGAGTALADGLYVSVGTTGGYRSAAGPGNELVAPRAVVQVHRLSLPCVHDGHPVSGHGPRYQPPR